MTNHPSDFAIECARDYDAVALTEIALHAERTVRFANTKSEVEEFATMTAGIRAVLRIAACKTSDERNEQAARRAAITGEKA